MRLSFYLRWENFGIVVHFIVIYILYYPTITHYTLQLAQIPHINVMHTPHVTHGGNTHFQSTFLILSIQTTNAVLYVSSRLDAPRFVQYRKFYFLLSKGSGGSIKIAIYLVVRTGASVS